MSFSSGTFSLYATGNPVVTGTTISSSWANNTLNDIASGLSTCLLKDGTQTVTANIPMATFKFTGLGDGSATTDSPSLKQVQNGFGSFLTSVAGTNTITATATPTPAYAVGQRFTFIPAVTNTGAVTLNISSVGAGAVQLGGAALVGGELVASMPVTVYVTATTPVFEIINLPALTGLHPSTFTMNGSGGTTALANMAYQKTANWITLNIRATQATSGTSSTKFVANTALPVALRPAEQQNCVITYMQNNAASLATPGLVTILTSGVVEIWRDNAGTAFSDGTTCGTSGAQSVTYYIGAP